MAIHVLIPCSKTKSIGPSKELIWDEGVSLVDWVSSWNNTVLDTFEVRNLYTGRATRNQLEMVEERTDAYPYLISAGAGLVRVNDGVKIPSYEATFGNFGPSLEEWCKLPCGGLSNIEFEEGDVIVAFAPPRYLKAIYKDPEIDRLWEYIVAPESSCLGKYCGFPVNVHPRIKEILGVGAADLNTELIRIFLELGVAGIEKSSDLAGKLPPLPERKSVDDEELLKIVKQHHRDKTLMELIRFIRDNLQISASVERISKARKIVHQ